jgi:hypothetical protein
MELLLVNQLVLLLLKQSSAKSSLERREAEMVVKEMASVVLEKIKKETASQRTNTLRVKKRMIVSEREDSTETLSSTRTRRQMVVTVKAISKQRSLLDQSLKEAEEEKCRAPKVDQRALVELK